jgi:hypothetical protein
MKHFEVLDQLGNNVVSWQSMLFLDNININKNVSNVEYQLANKMEVYQPVICWLKSLIAKVNCIRRY